MIAANAASQREREVALGVPLLSRTTRRVTMADKGARSYADSVEVLRLIDEAGEEAKGARTAPAGTIRLSCTAEIGVLHISRLVFGTAPADRWLVDDLLAAGRLEVVLPDNVCRRSR